MINLKRLLFAATSMFLSSAAFSQISLPQNTIVTENFNALGSSATAALPAAWKMSSAGTGATATYAGGTNLTATTQAASSGLPSGGGRYNWATTAGTDRAMGFLTDAGYASPNAIMAHYRNTTGATVNSVNISFSIERYVVNTSTASVAFFYSTDGTTWTAVPNGDVSTAEFPTGAAAGSFSAPKTITKAAGVSVTVPNNGDVYFRWVFTNTGGTAAQGLGLDNVSVYAGPATPVLTAKLKDLLQVDNGNQNQFNEGDVIRYQTVIKNVGSGAAGNVQLNIPPPSNTTLVPGSIKTSTVAVDDKYVTSFNTTLSGTSVLVNDFGVPAPTAVLTYGTTADATATNAGAVRTTEAGGAIALNANGTFTYTPLTGFSGVDRIKYITGNGNLPNNDAVVTITVAPDISFTTTNVDPSCNGGSNGSITFNASGGNGTLTYSITGAAGTFQASNVFTGLSAGTYNLAVKDAGGYIKTGTATLNNPAAIVVNGDIPNQVYNIAMSPVSFTKTGGSGSITWSISGQPTGITINSSTGQVSGTPTQTGSFTAIVTATDVNGCTGSINDAFTVAPNLSNDSYTAIGNTQLVADAHSAPSTPFAVNATNLTANDGSNAAVTVTAVTNAATTAGGTITINAAGKFIYTPLLNFTGSDSYTYTGTSNGISATATINFTVANMVWYVNNTYANANGTPNGTSHRPYTDVATAEGASAINQVIYVHTGSGNTTGNALLKAGQALKGAGNVFTLGALSIPAGTRPVLTGTITLANNVTVDGFDMITGSSTALSGSAATGVNVNITTITANGAANAINLTGISGTITINGGTLTGGAGSVVNINGGSASFTYSGTINQTTAGQRLISVQSITGGSITFSGNLSSTGSSTGIILQNNTSGTINFSGAAKTINTGVNPAVTLSSNAGTTINFPGGGLAVTTTSATAFSAVSGGSLSIAGAGNIITSGTGRAIHIDGVTSTGITLQRVSASGGGSTAIYLNNAGSGGFTITGLSTTAATGGVINAISGTDNVLTTGVGIYLNNTDNISLSNMNFTGAFGNYGIRGEDVTNFTLKESNFTGSFGTSDAANEGTIYFGTQGGSISGLTGTALFEGNNIAGGFEDNVNIYVTTGGVLNLTFRDGTNQAIIGLNHISGGNDGIIVETAGSGSVTTTINGVEFSGARGDMFQSAINGSSTQNVTVTNNTFHNTHGDIAPGGGGITLNGAGASTNYNLTYTISGNSFRGAEGSPIFVGHSGTNATIRGVILNNIIGIDDNVTSNVQASTGSSAGGFGIGVRMEHNSTGGGIIRHAVRIEGNQVRDIIGGLSAIYLSANGDGTSGNTVLEATVRNNIMEELDGNVYAGLYSMVGGASSLGDFARMGLDVSNNTVVLPSSGSGGNPIAFDQVSADARYYFPGYVPGPNGANGEFATPAGNASQVLHNFLTTAPKSNILPNNGPFPNMSAYRVDASLVKFISGLAFTMLVP